jgi:trans-aconitate methyltransferase
VPKAEQVLEVLPQIKDIALENRAFLGRALRLLAGRGFEQFLDIGTGIPGPGHTNEVVRAAVPGARIVGVDTDPIVVTYGRALLVGDDPARTAIVHGDLRDPAAILSHPELARVLDFGRPIALLLAAVLHFVDDADNPAGIVDTLMQALPAGSALVLSHGAGDLLADPAHGLDPDTAAKAAIAYNVGSVPVTLRAKAQVEKFFDGLHLLEPGLVQLPWWHPEQDELPPNAHDIWAYGGVGQKR